MQHNQQQPPHAAALSIIPTPATPPQNGDEATEAPPKQVALAMERLVQAGRLIADIRLGADRLLEGLFTSLQPHQIELFVKGDASMRQHLQDLRSIGRQLEESGVLNESLRSRSNSWGLHMPLVCPDGAVVAYAWKRQLAGQAGASAVDRTRLALKAFTDQKRRFFPHLDDPASKKHKCESRSPVTKNDEELADCRTLMEILTRLENEVSDMKVSTYQRLDWLKKASLLPSSSDESAIGASKEPSFHASSRLRTGQMSSVAENEVAVVELLCPSIFRAVVSLHPAGSIDPDAVAFFSPDEGGSYVHARGSSVYHVFRFISEHAAMALQYFLGSKTETALYYLLHWVCSYQSVFTDRCSKCSRLLSMDKQSALILPPVQRSYREFSVTKTCSIQSNSSTRDRNLCDNKTYHIDCFLEESKSSV